ncbi:hypothetical protein LVJ83_06565 [Uruburuella testudinis]|uniref:Uncharacterized protein n=1 Tax=Uruburuella testudinis TaxID=1282863 RepID=A0ABY4DVR4_9NEIS|nr:hypothetical protein [Uruburuella testudinis]UOO83117.1 hypothetical protein LVJ83_06565 [Uruburuella testudinis]
MRQLDIKDLEIVTGAVGVPGAVFGAASGLASYAGNISTGPNEWDWVDAAMVVGVGAVAGAVTGPVGANRAVHAIGILGVGGVVAGGMQSVRTGTVTIGPVTSVPASAPDPAGNNYCDDGTDY